MITENDRAFIEALMADMARLGPPTDIVSYRKMVDVLLEDRKNGGSMPRVGGYHRNVDLGGGLLADIAVPEGAGPFPVALVSHGNGGAAGSSHSYRRFTHDMAGHGFVTVTPDFRLAPEHRHPAGLNDMIAAARWASQSIGTYGGDPDRMVMIGDSSGAGQALAVVLRLLEDPDGPRFRAFAGLEGFYERMRTTFLTPLFMPEGYTEEDQKAVDVSPINGVLPGVELPPILLITGSADMAAPSSLELAGKLLAGRFRFALHILEGMPHDFMKFPALDGYREGHRIMAEYLHGCLRDA